MPRPAWHRWLASGPAAVVAGIAHTFSFAPFELWWLQCLALAVLALGVAEATPRRAARLAWLFGLGWLSSGLWWLYVSMHDFGGLAPWMAALAVMLLALWLALYAAGAMALFAALRCSTDRRGGPVVNALLFAACWLLAELGRATLFTGFPWIASGYAHTVGPLAAWAPWIGVYGLCALGAFVAWSLAAWAGAAAGGVDSGSGSGPATRRKAAIGLSVASLVLVGVGHLLPSGFTRSTGTVDVSLLQPNVPQNLKFEPSRLDHNLRQLAQQVAAARGTVVITPESVVPLSRHDLNEAYWANLVAPFLTSERALMVGIFLGNDEDGYVNSLVGLSSTADEYRYGKRHLLPFGEFIPPGFGWFVQLLDIPLADQARGRNTDSFAAAGQRFRPLICYEDLFGEHFVDSAIGDDAATIFVNVSNLAWFGRLMVQEQHLQFSQMRALEFQRPVIRSTNTGATAVVDHTGAVAAQLPAWTEGTLDATVEGRIGDTPYARWLSRLGLWPLLLAALCVLLPAFVASRRDRARGAA